MESRKITVYQTKNQSKKTIMSAATTLAELKEDLRANNIDYDGMTFFEGTSKVELKNDNSILPQDVPYKGTVTNELVFMLTNTNKKIKSGSMTKVEKKNSIQEVETPQTAAPTTPTSEVVDVKARAAIKELVDILVEEDSIYDYQAESILNILGDSPIVVEGKDESSYSNNEVKDMFDGWAK